LDLTSMSNFKSPRLICSAASVNFIMSRVTRLAKNQAMSVTHTTVTPRSMMAKRWMYLSV